MACQEELDQAIENAEQQDTVDEVSGLSLSDVLEEGEEQGIQLTELEEGEVVTYKVKIAKANTAAAVKATAKAKEIDVTIKRLDYYNYSDYGLGTYVTAPCQVSFGDVTARASIIAIHNHPSGSPEPSKDDMLTTRRLQDAGDLMGIELLDHIIVGATNREMFSFQKAGMLERKAIHRDRGR